MNHITNQPVKRSHHTTFASPPLLHTYATPHTHPQMSHIIPPGQFLSPPTNAEIPTIPFTCSKGLHGNYVRHWWETTTRGDKEPQTEKISNLKGTSRPKGARTPCSHTTRSNTRAGHCTRYGTVHPIRGTAPDQKRCIAYGSGAAPQHTRTNAELANRATPGPHGARRHKTAPASSHGDRGRGRGWAGGRGALTP